MPKVDKTAVSDATAFFISRPAAPAKGISEELKKEEDTKGLVADDSINGSADMKDSQTTNEKPQKRSKVKKQSSGELKVKKGFLLSASMDKKIDIVAAELGIKKSELVEIALAEYFVKHCSEKKKGN